MEQKTAPPDPLAKSYPANDLIPPHERFAALCLAFALGDDEAAGLLAVSRPVVARTRLATRPPSFALAARIEAVFGIPCAHWQKVPPTVKAARAGMLTRQRMAAQARKGKAS